MLDAETKLRIDSARQMLVGKVPDPKSQVEQITIALIYKFMDDMDAEAEDLGGKRKFFTGKFAKYGWAQLMSPSLGGHDMLALYSEGIAKMPENPGIPLLFRDIFKNAFLPYRDPETLKAFLKIINEFSYDHSERLGDAFEYLLSVLGSQGDAGQFRTPRHIIDFMVEILNPQKGEVVLDPACGTAGFLISAYKHIVKANTDAKGHSKLTPADRGKMAENFKGYDISPDMVRLSLVNMYLHGFTDPHIYEYDTLTSDERWNEYADVILANPPFMSPTGGIKPHKRFSIQAKRSEVLFVDYMAEHLTPKGRAGIIVPEGVIFQSQGAYTQLRKMLVEKYLIGVISLPSGVFMPYTGVKTSILVLDCVQAKRNPYVMFSEVRDIGFSLGVKRTPTEHNDLPNVISDYRAYYSGKSLSKNSWRAKRANVLAGDAGLVGARYKTVEGKSKQRLVAIGDVCRIKKGSYSSTKAPPGPYRLVLTAADSRTADGYDFEGPSVCIPLISSLGHGKAALHRIHYAEGRFALANLLVALQPLNTSQLDARFLYRALDSRRDDIAGLMKGAANVGMKPEDLKRFKIPLPSLEVQKEMVAVIEGYQKVIDGARAVIDSYRPHISIRPDWPLRSVGSICSLRTGTTPDTNRSDYYIGDVNFVKTGEINNNIISNVTTQISKRAVKDYNLIIFPKGTVLMAMYGQGKTRGQVAYLNVPACTTQNAAAITPNESVDPMYLFFYFLGQYERLRKHGIEGHISHLNLSYLKTFEIPLPPLGIQQEIVAELEAEQALVNANRELIARFEKKIQATLARVWGDEAELQATAAA